MQFNSEIHRRQSIRLCSHDYSSPGFYFFTICSYERQPIFGDVIDGKMALSNAGVVVESAWRELSNHYTEVELHEHITMPNHFHGIVHIVGEIHESPLRASPIPLVVDKLQRRRMLLSRLIGRLKMVSSKAINVLRNNSGSPVWQRNYHEHIIRHEEAYWRVTEYIRNNPQNWQEDTYYKR